MKKSITTITILLFIIVLLFCFISHVAAMHPKWGNSDTLPAVIVRSNGYYQCRYNIQPVKKNDEYGTRAVYDYDYIELLVVSPPSIAGALIENECSGDLIDGVIHDIMEAWEAEKFKL